MTSKAFNLTGYIKRKVISLCKLCFIFLSSFVLLCCFKREASASVSSWVYIASSHLCLSLWRNTGPQDSIWPHPGTRERKARQGPWAESSLCVPARQILWKSQSLEPGYSCEGGAMSSLTILLLVQDFLSLWCRRKDLSIVFMSNRQWLWVHTKHMYHAQSLASNWKGTGTLGIYKMINGVGKSSWLLRLRIDRWYQNS